MYKLFLQLHDKDTYEKLENGDLTCKPVVKYKFYEKYMKENFNLSFGYPRTDTCQTCDRLKVLVEHEIDPEIKQQLEVEKEVHVKQRFFTQI